MATRKKTKGNPGPLIREASEIVERAAQMDGKVLELSRREIKVVDQALRVARLIDSGMPLEAFPAEGGEGGCPRCGLVETHRVIDWHPDIVPSSNLTNLHTASAIYYVCNECGEVVAAWINRTRYDSYRQDGEGDDV